MTTVSNSPNLAGDSANAGKLLVGAAKQAPASKLDKVEAKKLDDAARQFEAVFLRQMLSSLERTTSTPAGKEAGSNLYGSMMVDAVADAISRAGGMGLASMLKHSLEPQLTQGVAVRTEPTQLGSNSEKVGIGRAMKAAVPGTGGGT